MVKTRRGIYHDLQESEYATSNGEVAFVFSSKFYRDKFLLEYIDNREIYQHRMHKAFELDNLNITRLADLKLYVEIEKRGFRVYCFHNVGRIKRGDLTWQESHRYASWNVTNPNIADWYVMPIESVEEHLKNMV